ncbi:MAG: hypothetical protein ACRC62_26650 [Microcoleus sp.]
MQAIASLAIAMTITGAIDPDLGLYPVRSMVIFSVKLDTPGMTGAVETAETWEGLKSLLRTGFIARSNAI